MRISPAGMALIGFLTAWPTAKLSAEAPAPPATQRAAAGANLLKHNPGFDDPGNFGGGNGVTHNIPGWEADYWAWDYFGVEGKPDAGRRFLNLNHGGRLTTAAADRVPVQPGTVYRMGFDAATPVEQFPDSFEGLTPSIQFFDASGKLIKNAKGQDVEVGGVYPWQHFTLERGAPAGAATAGVQVIAPQGAWPHPNTRTTSVDDFSLESVPESNDTVSARKVPLLIQPGALAPVVLRYTAAGDRAVLVNLTQGGKVIASAQCAVAAGRGVATVTVQIPPDVAQGSDYSWDVRIIAPGDAAHALAGFVVPQAFSDERMTGSGRIDADNPDFLFAGRWDRGDAKRPTMYWGGTQVITRFRGTSVSARMDTNDGNEMVAVVDGRDDQLVKFKVAGGVAKIASGLPDKDHTLVIMKNTESGSPVAFLGLKLDPGRGLLRPAPLPARRIEFYGDSITSGGIPDPAVEHPDPNKDGDYAGNFYRTYAGFTARALDADYRVTSKGGTGVSGSWVFKFTLRDYWNLLDFDGFHPEAARRWDTKTWQPDVVVVTIGHNDRFRMPSREAFVKAYQGFVGDLRAAYPNAHIFCSNTSMGNDVIWRAAVIPLLGHDPKLHFQLFDPPEAHSGHPRLADHQQMATGNVEWNGMIDWIGDEMGW